MNDELKATHADLLDQVRGIMEALSQLTDPEREELLAKAEALVTGLEGMKV
jgi:hypothetical protein